MKTGSIAYNLKSVLEHIEKAAERAGRNPADIILVAVSKNHPPQAVIEAVESGVKHIGENRLQEAEIKFAAIRTLAPHLDFTRHLVGHLQTNKVRKALTIFDLIQSVDSDKLLDKISSEAVELGESVDILLQVNTSGEVGKFGVEPWQAPELAAYAAEKPHIRVKGLMTIGAFLPNPEQVRPCFVKLRETAEKITAAKILNLEMKYLSMGMTNDFEVAVEEGANILRIGTAIFGSR